MTLFLEAMEIVFFLEQLHPGEVLGRDKFLYWFFVQVISLPPAAVSWMRYLLRKGASRANLFGKVSKIQVFCSHLPFCQEGEVCNYQGSTFLTRFLPD